MKRAHAFIVSLLCLITLSAHAGHLDTKENGKAGQINIVKVKDPLEACAGVFKKESWGIAATFPNGAKFEVIQTPSGMPHSFLYRSADGTEQTAHVSDYIAQARLSSETAAADPATHSDSYLKLQRQVAQYFKKFLGENCKHLLAGTPSGRSKPVDGTISPMDYDDPFTPDYQDWNNWNEAAFMFEANYMVDDMFYGGMYDFVENLKNKLPACRTVVTDCQTTCDRIGGYGGGVACGGLGAIAGTVLTPPIGIAVGAYCAGKVFVKVEECRSGCNLPIVECTW